ncbi:MAG: ferritin-like domain-containing protein [Armatimonadota bacterium]
MQIPTDPAEVVQAAIRFEEEGHRILSEAGKRARHPLSRATFEFLAEQELAHIEAIKAFASSPDFDPSGLVPITKRQAGEKIKGLFAEFQSQFESTAGLDDERMEVYGVALDMERKGHDFYEHAAAQAEDPRARKLYEFLAGEETRHFELIQDTRDFLAQPDAFMAVEERWMQI